MRFFKLIILQLIAFISCNASPKSSFGIGNEHLKIYSPFFDTIPNDQYWSVITIKAYNQKVDQCIFLLKEKQLKDISDLQHQEIILCFNSLRDLKMEDDYVSFTELLKYKCYFEDILLLYPDYLPGRGLGYYFPKLRVAIFGAPNPKYRYKILK